MKPTPILAFLIAATLAAPAFAASPDIKEIKQETLVMNECAGIAEALGKVQVPANHAKARAMDAANKTLTDPKARRAAIDPVHVKFMQLMELETKKLDECGKRYDAGLFESEAVIEKLRSAHLKEEEGKPLVADLTSYRDAKTNLGKAIASLSRDRQTQSYVHKILKARFLKKAEKGAN